MRGADEQTSHMFSYLSPEMRIAPDHPLRAIRRITDEALREISPALEALYSDLGRPSIPPEQLLRALVIQVLHSVRSERLLMEEIREETTGSAAAVHTRKSGEIECVAAGPARRWTNAGDPAHLIVVTVR